MKIKATKEMETNWIQLGSDPHMFKIDLNNDSVCCSGGGSGGGDRVDSGRSKGDQWVYLKIIRQRLTTQFNQKIRIINIFGCSFFVPFISLTISMV